MAKKFGKILLLTAAIGTAAAAAYYYMQKKDSAADIPEDEDYDDFSEDLDENADPARNYVALNTEAKTEAPAETAKEDSGKQEAGESSPGAGEENSFTPLSEQVKETEETVEKFFDEEDSSGDNTPADSH